jgi:hypothetical protein
MLLGTINNIARPFFRPDGMARLATQDRFIRAKRLENEKSDTKDR